MILLDIDGVVVNNEGVFSFEEWEKNFFYLKPNQHMIDLISPHLSRTLFVTARAEKYRQRTMEWFLVHWPDAIDKGIGFRFRPEGDLRLSWEVKKDIAVEIMKTYKQTPTLAIDDLGENCDMFRSLGIPAMQHLTPKAPDYLLEPYDRKFK